MSNAKLKEKIIQQRNKLLVKIRELEEQVEIIDGAIKMIEDFEKERSSEQTLSKVIGYDDKV